MSEHSAGDPFDADDPAAATRQWIGAGRAGELVEATLRALSVESAWRRARALEVLAAVAPPDPLLPPLAEALRDAADAERRNAARSALAALASPEAATPGPALALLARLAHDDDDVDVRILAASALGESGHPGAREPLEAALRDAEPNVAAAAADGLAVLGDPRALDALLQAASGDGFWVRIASVLALGRLGEPGAIPLLSEAVREPWLAGAAAQALGEIGTPEALAPLEAAIDAGTEARAAALEAATRILGLHPDVEPPRWLRVAAAAEEPALAERFRKDADAGVARLLGLAGSESAATLLLEQLGVPGREAVASLGLEALPADVAGPAVTTRLSSAPPHERLLLLRVLPRLSDPDAVRSVARYLADPDPEVRSAAADALARADDSTALPVLEALVDDPGARLGAVLAYSRLGPARCGPLDRLLDDADPRVRAAAAEGLARCGPEHEPHLRRALEREEDATARQRMIRALGMLGGPRAVEDLAALLGDPDDAVRFAAVQALGRTGSPSAFAPLLQALVDARPEVQAAALNALGTLGDPRAVPPLASHLGSEDRDLRRTAAFALDRLAPAGALDRLLGALEDPDREVRIAAIHALRYLKRPAILQALERAADRDADALVRQAAWHALEAMRGAPGSGGR